MSRFWDSRFLEQERLREKERKQWQKQYKEEQDKSVLIP